MWSPSCRNVIFLLCEIVHISTSPLRLRIRVHLDQVGKEKTYVTQQAAGEESRGVVSARLFIQLSAGGGHCVREGTE